MREHAIQMTGEDHSAGMAIAAMVRMLANLYDTASQHEGDERDISGPRLGILFRLWMEEKIGSREGITPTALSRNSNVTRNTTSALLRGLEEQGLVERSLDPSDRRLFRIRLSEAGRSLVTQIGPARVRYADQLASGLSEVEQEQLLDLLGKLFASVQARCECQPEMIESQPAETRPVNL
jgi:DNA-binding MarR family transcriptional regulator